MIFVVGNSRSGTTMFARVLGRNPRVFTFEELHFFGQFWEPADAGEPLTAADATAVAARLMTNQRDGILSRRDPRRFMDEAAAVIHSLGEMRTAPAVFKAVLALRLKMNYHPVTTSVLWNAAVKQANELPGMSECAR